MPSEERQKQIQQKVTGFIAEQFPDNSFEKFYPRAEVRKFIKDRLIKNCENFDDDETKRYLEGEVAKRFDDIKRCRKRLGNALRKEREIKKCELMPGRIDISAAAEQMKELVPTLPVGSPKRGWVPSKDGFERSVGGHFWSFAGGSEKEYESILGPNGDKPIEHTSHPGWRYRNNVIDAQRVARSELKVSEADLEKFLEKGERLTDEEERKIRQGQDEHQRAKNLMESALGGVLSLTSAAGKGIISKSRAEEDSRFRSWEKKRNEMVAKVMWQLGPSVKNAAYLDTVLAEVTQSLSSGSSDEALASQAVLSRVKNLIAEKQKEEDELAKKRAEAMQKKSDDMGEGMVSDLQKLVDEEDSMYKYRMLQIFLLLTPIGGLSIFGSVLSNWVGPLSELLGPLFDSSTSFGEGIASMGTSEVLGPFGDFAKLLKVDVATKWILENAPIISEFGDLFDFLVKNDIAQGFIGTVAPLVGSPMVPLFVAGLYSLFRADKEFAHSGKVGEFMTGKLKEVESEFDKFAKETVTIKDATGKDVVSEPMEKRVAKFAKDKFEIMEKANADAKLAAFIFGSGDKELDDERLAIFKDVKFKDGAKQKTFAELKVEKKLSSASDVMKFLNSDQAANKACLDKFLLFQAVGAGEFASAQADKEKAEKLIAEQQAKLNQDFVIDAAQKSHHLTVHTDRKKMYEDFKAQFVEEETKRLSKLAQDRMTAPHSPPAPKSVTPPPPPPSPTPPPPPTPPSPTSKSTIPPSTEPTPKSATKLGEEKEKKDSRSGG